MSRAIRFHAAARVEFAEAAEWYEAKKPGLGAEFVAEIDRCLERAAERPDGFPVVHHGLRRAAVRRFPYCVYFRDDTRQIRVFAVFHTSRDPMVWRDRS